MYVWLQCVIYLCENRCMCGFRVLSTWVKQVYVGFQGVIYMGNTGVCGVSGCYLHG